MRGSAAAGVVVALILGLVASYIIMETVSSTGEGVKSSAFAATWCDMTISLKHTAWSGAAPGGGTTAIGGEVERGYFIEATPSHSIQGEAVAACAEVPSISLFRQLEIGDFCAYEATIDIDGTTGDSAAALSGEAAEKLAAYIHRACRHGKKLGVKFQEGKCIHFKRGVPNWSGAELTGGGIEGAYRKYVRDTLFDESTDAAMVDAQMCGIEASGTLGLEGLDDSAGLKLVYEPTGTGRVTITKVDDCELEDYEAPEEAGGDCTPCVMRIPGINVADALVQRRGRDDYYPCQASLVSNDYDSNEVMWVSVPEKGRWYKLCLAGTAITDAGIPYNSGLTNFDRIGFAFDTADFDSAPSSFMRSVAYHRAEPPDYTDCIDVYAWSWASSPEFGLFYESQPDPGGGGEQLCNTDDKKGVTGYFLIDVLMYPEGCAPPVGATGETMDYLPHGPEPKDINAKKYCMAPDEIDTDKMLWIDHTDLSRRVKVCLKSRNTGGNRPAVGVGYDSDRWKTVPVGYLQRAGEGDGDLKDCVIFGNMKEVDSGGHEFALWVADKNCGRYKDTDYVTVTYDFIDESGVGVPPAEPPAPVSCGSVPANQGWCEAANPQYVFYCIADGTVEQTDCAGYADPNGGACQCWNPFGSGTNNFVACHSMELDAGGEPKYLCQPKS